MATTFTAPTGSGARVRVQKFGTFLSNMIMPNIPALIAWGLLTALFIDVGWLPERRPRHDGRPDHPLRPADPHRRDGRPHGPRRPRCRGRRLRGDGCDRRSDLLVANFNADLPAGDAPLGQVHMFIGAMILGPLTAYIMKRLDALWDGKVKAGFEMLVNMFSAGILAFVMAIVGFWVVARRWSTRSWRASATRSSSLVDNDLLPLTSIVIEPAKVFFLNNAINHGVLTPLGLTEAADTGKSVLFLLEANPGPGLGLLLAYSFFGRGVAKATAPGAAIIQFFGGIHEIYFPYVLMKPQTDPRHDRRRHDRRLRSTWRSTWGSARPRPRARSSPCTHRRPAATTSESRSASSVPRPSRSSWRRCC